MKSPATARREPSQNEVKMARQLVGALENRDHQALLVHAGRVAGHRAGDGTADVVVVAERLHERDDFCVGEDRDGDA